MSTKDYERALARICSEKEYAQKFLANPADVLKEFDLTEVEKELLCAIDREGLGRNALEGNATETVVASANEPPTHKRRG